MHVSPAEISPPEQTVAPASPPPEPPRKRWAPLLIILTVALSLVVAAWVAMYDHGRSLGPKLAPSSTSTRSVGTGVRLTGTTEAVHMRSIVAPMLASEHFGTLTVIG